MRSPLPLLLLMPLLSCSEINDLKLRVTKVEDELKRVERRAFCPQDVKQLLEDVWKNTQCSEDQICVSQLIGRTVGMVDPTGQGRFLSMMSSQPYAVFYPEHTLSGGHYEFSFGARERGDRERLRRLVFPPWLPITKFLVVANMGPDGNRVKATGAIKFMLKQLSEISFEPEFSRSVYRFEDTKLCTDQQSDQPGGLRVLRWAFTFSLKPGEQFGIFDQPPPAPPASSKPAPGVRRRPLRELPAPPITPPTLGIEDAIIIFRIDCPLTLTELSPGGGKR